MSGIKETQRTLPNFNKTFGQKIVFYKGLKQANNLH